MVDESPVSGRTRRERKTRRSVLIADRTADWIIHVGGIGVIAAVLAIVVFLVHVIVPLFEGGRVTAERSAAMPSGGPRALAVWLDEAKTIAVALRESGEVSVVHVASGRVLPSVRFDFGAVRPTAFGRTIAGIDVAFGFADGTVRLGKIEIGIAILPGNAVPAGAEPLGPGAFADAQAVYERVTGDQVRKVSVAIRLDPPETVAPGRAIVALDLRRGGTAERPTEAFVTVDADGVPRISHAESKRNILTGQVRKTVSTAILPPLPAGTAVAGALMTETADQVFIADRAGTVWRYDTRDLGRPALAETRRLLSDDAGLGVFGFLIGEQSLVVGASDGSVDVYFLLPREGAGTTDGRTLVRAHALERQPAGIVALAVSQRAKTFATADSAGHVWLRHSTSEQTLLKTQAGAANVAALAIGPRDDGIAAFANDTLTTWDIDAPHPETTWATIFGRVWYEGYPRPGFTWQSSSGTDSFEPKLSLVPLIFGTFKATLYSLLFAVPVAILAAIYTSEFVHHKVRAVVKPAMEMMASLPSVVLGFVAALVLAPLVETWIVAVILAVLLMPLALLAGAMAWQTLPQARAIRYGGIPKFALMFAALVAAALAAHGLAPAFESLFFAGDFKAWTGGKVGAEEPFLAVILWPLVFVAVGFAEARLETPVTGAAWRERLRRLPRERAGVIEGIHFVILIALAGALAFALAGGLAAAGFGLRGTVVDTYVQRNTLIVGFAMGFAVIPIIYTIAEDALNSVPEHLRAASLACGATQWQTAVRVILPTAISGVFAAVMVGMGRAVGETMIVVMAAGNTPILDMNIFDGLRALSANIAVELPEAVRAGTLYRMLFLAAMSLFVMTFVVNTLAEIVRLRFRKRAAQL
ncbi:MAG: ABC transporter permease subunit [Rhodospirillales bacterium]|nr:ABC transporter permease subunit [Rhodospirillales bacterium]MSP80387.1 ABC transporter permease subunit [Rhodospirillales bacterium]